MYYAQSGSRQRYWIPANNCQCLADGTTTAVLELVSEHLTAAEYNSEENIIMIYQDTIHSVFLSTGLLPSEVLCISLHCSALHYTGVGGFSLYSIGQSGCGCPAGAATTLPLPTNARWCPQPHTRARWWPPVSSLIPGDATSKPRWCHLLHAFIPGCSTK